MKALQNLGIAGHHAAQVVAVDHEDFSFLAAGCDYPVRTGQKERSTGAKIGIAAIQSVEVRGRKEIQTAQGSRRQLQQTLTEIVAAVKGAVPRGKIQVAVGIKSRRDAAHPDAALASAGGSVEDAKLREGRGIVRHQPAVIGPGVAERCPPDINHSRRKGQ